MSRPVFVYGTLTDSEQVRRVIGRARFAGDADLVGLHRVDGEYPTLAPGGRTAGRLLATDDLAALDRYEGVDRGLYERVAVPLAEGDGECWTYVGDPEHLGVTEEVAWPGEGTFADRVRAYCRDATVVVRRS